MSLKKMVLLLVVAGSFCIASSFPHRSSAAPPAADDRDSLGQLTAVRPLFDLNVGTAEELLFYLQVIDKTLTSLKNQGQKVDGIVAVRAGGVRLVTTEIWAFEEEDQQRLKEASALIARLAGEGVRFEACSVAMDRFKVDPATLLPPIKAVGNTFISLIGYQSRGYVLVPVK